MTDLNKAREVAQRLRDLQEGWASDMQIEAADTIDSLVAEVERLTKVDVEPVAYHYCYTNAFGHPVWNVGFHVPSEATEWHDLVPSSALAALQAENEKLKAEFNQPVPLSEWQQLRTQLAEAQADAARYRYALDGCEAFLLSAGFASSDIYAEVCAALKEEE